MSTTEPPVAPAPPEGMPLAVVGVAGEDVLNFRATPDPSATVVDRVPAGFDEPGVDITATGEGAWHGDQLWWQVRIADVESWANSHYLGVKGRSYSLSTFISGLAFESDSGLAELGRFYETIAAERFGDSVLEIVELESFADDAITSQAWIDVMGTPVDGVRGERIHLVMGHLLDEEPKVVGGRIISAEGTLICEAGPPSDGTCDVSTEYAPPGCFISIHQEQQCEAAGGEIDLGSCGCIDGSEP